VSNPSGIPKTRALLDQEEQLRVEKVRSEIAGRLHKACNHLTDEDFVKLVNRITKVQLEGEGR